MSAKLLLAPFHVAMGLPSFRILPHVGPKPMIQFVTQAFRKLTNAFPGHSGRLADKQPVSGPAPSLGPLKAMRSMMYA